MNDISKRYIFLCVFISGLITLGVEMSASRLLGSVFGTSNLVWASIIGLILVYLTVGYLIGGRLADKYPSRQTMYLIMLIAGISISIIPVFSQSVLSSAARAFDQLEMGVLLGSFMVVILLFLIPITLLGTISPIAIRITVDDLDKTGQIAGKLYAISTFGSFFGTFIPILILIPHLGTRSTILLFGIILCLFALIGFLLDKKDKHSIISILSILLVFILHNNLKTNAIKLTPGQIYENESAYNYIEVIEENGYISLRLNEGQGVHSIYHPDIFTYGGAWQYFSVAPFFNCQESIDSMKIDRVAIIGLAAGTSARQLTAFYSPSTIDGFEIDPEIIIVGYKYFGLEELDINSITIDGRVGLDRSSGNYDLIIIDAYRPPYIPWHLTTKEYFELTKLKLNNCGVLAINVGRAVDDNRLVNALYTTMKTVYKEVFVFDVPGTFNSILYATNIDNSLDLFQTKYSDSSNFSQIPEALIGPIDDVYHRVKTGICLEENTEACIVLTDDKAPIERITNSMILNMVVTGGLNELEP